MKKLKIAFLLLLSISFFNTIIAQKLRDKNLWIKYVQLPEEKLPETYMTYSVEAVGPSLVKSSINRDDFMRRFHMDGFKRLSGMGNDVGHLRVNIFSGFINAAQPEFKSVTRKTKDKEGNEISTTYYYYEFAFRNSSNYQIFNPEGQVLASANLPLEEIYESEESKLASAVKKNRNRYFNELEKKFADASLYNIQSKVNSVLSRQFDYQNKRAKHELFIIRSHSSEGQFLKHYERVKDIFESADYATSSTDLLDQLGPSIDYYAGLAVKDPRGNKKKKRIYRAANYNLALIYYYTDEFGKAREHCLRVLNSEGKDAKSKRILDKIARQERLMDIHGLNTLHHLRDIENAVAPAEIAELEAAKEEIEAKNVITKGLVYMGGTAINGTLTLDKTADDFVFGDGGNVSFVVEEDNELMEIDLCSEEVTSFQIADRKFSKIRFSPSAKGKQEASLQILEEVYSSKRIKLYKYYPSSGALSDEKPEFAFQKKMQIYPISLESTQFLLWERGLSNYFDNCKDLKEMALNGDIKKSKEDLIKAARIYSELCPGAIKP